MIVRNFDEIDRGLAKGMLLQLQVIFSFNIKQIDKRLSEQNNDYLQMPL